MITYVNTVLVSNKPANISNFKASEAMYATKDEVKDLKGSFVVENLDDNAGEDATITADTDKIRIGMYTGKAISIIDPKDKSMKYVAEIKWSNTINKADIKSYRKIEHFADTEDLIIIDFGNITPIAKDALEVGGKIVVLRLTYKDLPTRYRKWTDSYDIITEKNETAATLATKFATAINKDTKRARVTATANGGVLTLEAMKYDDDDSVDSINWAEKVRFNANMYWQDPNAPGFASSNKYILGENSDDSRFIDKVPGKTCATSAKLVRDRESQAMGYLGILNRGECTYPIIKPAMETNLDGEYDGITIEFENMYRAADDIFRKTKQTVEIYVPKQSANTICTALAPFMGTPETALNDTNAGNAFAEPVEDPNA